MSTDSTTRIEQAAADWLARRDLHVRTTEEQSAFEAWMNESMLHRVAYWRLERAWGEALRLKALGAGVDAARIPAVGQWNLSPFFAKRVSPSERMKIPAAAVVMLAMAVSMAWYWWPTGKSYETPVGGISLVPMADGSKITLNTNSEIKVALTADERRIDLKHGEAFFEVAKDPLRPFVVEAGDRRIIAVGTKFSVRREDSAGGSEVTIAVTEGSVRVEALTGSAMETPRPLVAGSVAHGTRQGLTIRSRQLPEVEEQLSWRSGVLVFRDATLGEAVDEFNRYNERKIVIRDASAAALRIAGSFRATNIAEFVWLLERGYPVRVDIEAARVVLSAR